MKNLYFKKSNNLFKFLLMVLIVTLSACKSDSNTADPNQPQNTFDILTIPTANSIVIPTPRISIQDVRFPVLPTEGNDVGKQLYETHCATCHGINGEGQLPDPLAPNMAPPHNNDGHTWHHPDQSNFETIWYGRTIAGNMPAFYDKLSEDEILQILAYIKSWWSDENLTIQLERTQAIMNE